MPEPYPFFPLVQTVQGLLRRFFQEKAEYALISGGGGRNLFTKDRIISLLERGWGGRSLEECLRELPPDDPGLLKDLPGDTPVLLVEGTTIRPVRLHQVREKGGGAALAPCSPFSGGPAEPAERPFSWLDASLPLLRWARGGDPELNAGAARMLPGGEERLSLLRALSEGEDVFSVGSGDQERAFVLRSLGKEYFLLEDVSGDVRVAEDVAWWAAVGKAFVERLERNGVRVCCRRGEGDPPGEGDVLNCAWEGHSLGRIRILCPDEPDVPGRPADPPTVPAEEDPAAESRGRGRRSDAPRQKSRRAARPQGE